MARIDPDVSRHIIISTPGDLISLDTLKSCGRAAVIINRIKQHVLKIKGTLFHKCQTFPDNSAILEVIEYVMLSGFLHNTNNSQPGTIKRRKRRTGWANLNVIGTSPLTSQKVMVNVAVSGDR